LKRQFRGARVLETFKGFPCTKYTKKDAYFINLKQVINYSAKPTSMSTAESNFSSF
jgi:hypothetical protein